MKLKVKLKKIKTMGAINTTDFQKYGKAAQEESEQKNQQSNENNKED